jgi:GDPmannose 4,6-dehydratase
MWLMLQQDKPDDYVIATGQTYSVQEFLDVVFDHAGLSVERHVEQAERYLRPQEVPFLLGNASKARQVLGWKPKTTFKELAIEMYESDLELAKKEQ